jgi:hypothetical protein
MNNWRIVKTMEKAKEQLLRLRKTVTERRGANMVNVYLVDGDEYSESELIQLANSIVKEIPTYSKDWITEP